MRVGRRRLLGAALVAVTGPKLAAAAAPIPPPASDAEVEVVPDVAFAAPGGRPLLADLFLPRHRPAPPPVVLFLHGGGWRFGDRRLAPDLKRFYARAGFATVSIDYRLSGEAIFPAALEDVKTAVRWLRASAGRHGFDPGRIGLWGSSAGGHLAAMCALTGPGLFEGAGHEDRSSAVQAVVDGYGPTDFLQADAHRDPSGTPSDDPESIQLPPGKRSGDPASLESLFVGAPIETVPERVERANPVRYAKPGAPPFLILHGLSDTAVPHQQSELLYEALLATGNAAALALVERLGHGFFNRSDLDDAGPRPMRVRRAQAGTGTGPAVERHEVFGLVGRFFAQHLG